MEFIVDAQNKLGTPARINVKDTAISVMVNSNPVLTFDKKGRLMWAYWNGHTFRRTLDNRVIEKWAIQSEGDRYRRYRELPESEKRAFLAQMHATMVDIFVAAREGKVESADQTATAEVLRAELGKILSYDAESLEQDATRFRRVYKPVSILPPDQYMALVIQATEGCSYNRCTFCTFYRDRAFRVKSDTEIRQHIAAVRDFFGEALGMRKSIFLADANALVIPQPRLVEIFRLIHEAFDILPEGLNPPERAEWKRRHPVHFDGIYSFIDAFTGKHKTVEEFAQLKALNLRRVYIGVETGHEPLLRFVNKPGTPEDILKVVSAIKGAGVGVGIIILIGLGGKQYAERHVGDTIRLLNAIPLSEGDLLYFSVLIEDPASPYAAQLREGKIEPLSRDEIQAQMEALRNGIRGGEARSPEELPPKVAVYDIREFAY